MRFREILPQFEVPSNQGKVIGKQWSDYPEYATHVGHQKLPELQRKCSGFNRYNYIHGFSKVD